MSEPKPLPLDAVHREMGGKMVPFAGYAMAVQYPMGVMAEHLHTREKAGLFDVSHMGQVVYTGPADALEALIPQNVAGLAEGRQRYGFLTLPNGGIADDLMFANRGDHVLLVVNGACKHGDMELLTAGLPEGSVHMLDDRALFALQGPLAEASLATLIPGVTDMRFMDVVTYVWNGVDLWISRSGYTGEDGFEISVPVAQAEALWTTLCAMDDVAPIGLGARDSLRLEAGMPLYGQDLTPDTTPVEADLVWGIQKSRRAGGFTGDAVIVDQLTNGAARCRTGLRPEGRAPMRMGVALYATAEADTPIGEVTSGGFGPTIGGPVAMGYVPSNLPAGTTIYGDVRGKRMPVTITDLPFHTPRYKR